MKGFKRQNQLFSLCGLNCGLCPMFLNKNCPGCGGGEGNQACKIARCSIEHGGVEYCFQCSEYPCDTIILTISTLLLRTADERLIWKRPGSLEWKLIMTIR